MASDPSAKINPAATPKADNDQTTKPAVKPAMPMQMGARGPIYTMTAAQGASAAELINSGMAKKAVGKNVQRRVLVAAPDGPSTQGGKHARQTITLSPVEGQQGAIIMCGWLDVAKKEAGLRDYKAVAEQFKARSGKQIDLTPEEYLSIINELEKFMGIIKVSVTHERVNSVEKAAVVAQNIAEVEPEPEPPSRTMLIVVGAVIVVAAIGMVVALLR
jgi:hypothetical protein